MSRDDRIGARGRVTLRTLILPVIIAIASFLAVLYLRISPSWDSSSNASIIGVILPIILMWIFYVAAMVTLANLREMQGTVAGWFDVLGLLVAEGILVYLVFANLLYIAIVIALCVLFVAYVNFAQAD